MGQGNLGYPLKGCVRTSIPLGQFPVHDAHDHAQLETPHRGDPIRPIKGACPRLWVPIHQPMGMENKNTKGGEGHLLYPFDGMRPPHATVGSYPPATWGEQASGGANPPDYPALFVGLHFLLS